MRLVATVLLAQVACLPEIPPVPTLGFGPPYRGTGEPIYVRDNPSDWAITEGSNTITSEQALEATGDREYEARREEIEAYNHKLHREARLHHAFGYTLMLVGLAAVGGGIALGLEGQSNMANMAVGSATAPTLYAHYGLSFAGILVFYYAFTGARVPPPYIEWRTPPALDRPAYVRQLTEPYNERMKAP
jgi:hypothetical protein